MGMCVCVAGVMLWIFRLVSGPAPVRFLVRSTKRMISSQQVMIRAGRGSWFNEMIWWLIDWLIMIFYHDWFHSPFIHSKDADDSFPLNLALARIARKPDTNYCSCLIERYGHNKKGTYSFSPSLRFWELWHSDLYTKTMTSFSNRKKSIFPNLKQAMLWIVPLFRCSIRYSVVRTRSKNKYNSNERVSVLQYTKYSDCT